MKRLILIFFCLFLPSTAWAVNFLNQSNTWEGDLELLTCYIDVDDADSSFGRTGGEDYYAWAEDDAGAVNRAILIDFVWDSLFGYGFDKIPNPSQVDSCNITDVKLIYYTVDEGTAADSIIVWRALTDFDVTGTSYPTYNRPKSGSNWAGADADTAFALARDVYHGTDADSVLHNNKTGNEWDTCDVPNVMWQRFTDTTALRTGLVVSIATDDSETFEAIHQAAGSYFKLYVEWDEFGVKSTEPDSQKVAVKDTYIFDPVGGTAARDKNYGICDSLFVWYYVFGVTHKISRILFEPKDVDDSLNTFAAIDSGRCWFNVSTLTSGSMELRAHKMIQWWGEGDQCGASDDCGCVWDDYIFGGGDPEECPNKYSWASAGADGAGDRESTAFDTVTVSATGWQYCWIPDTVMQGMVDNWNTANPSKTNYTGLQLAQPGEDDTDTLYISATDGGSNIPYIMVYFQTEVEPETTGQIIIIGDAGEVPEYYPCPFVCCARVW